MDTTRVFSFKMGRDSSARVFPERGTDRPFHLASHHGGREANVLDFYLINKYHVGMLPYFFQKLKSIEEGDTHLLDKTMIIYGAPMGNSNVHNHGTSWQRSPAEVQTAARIANASRERGMQVAAEPLRPGQPEQDIDLGQLPVRSPQPGDRYDALYTSLVYARGGGPDGAPSRGALGGGPSGDGAARRKCRHRPGDRR